MPLRDRSAPDQEGEFPMLRREGKELLAEVTTPFMRKRGKLDMPFTADALFASARRTSWSRRRPGPA
jgi:hypothetical protein